MCTVDNAVIIIILKCIGIVHERDASKFYITIVTELYFELFETHKLRWPTRQQVNSHNLTIVTTLAVILCSYCPAALKPMVRLLEYCLHVSPVGSWLVHTCPGKTKALYELSWDL